MGRTIAFILLLVLVSAFSPGVAQAATPQKQVKILVLHSYHKGLGWTDSISQGIEAALDKSHIFYELFYEFLDSKRISDDEHIANLVSLLRHKYANKTFDAIILSDDFAFTFMLKYHDDLFSDTPVVFCGVNYFEDHMIAGHPLITGVVEAFSLKGTIEGALHINPAVSRLVVINDSTITGLANRILLDNLAMQYQGRLRFDFIGFQTMLDIRKFCSLLPSDTVVLLSSFTRDSTGEVFSLERSADLITESSKVPVYSLWDFHLQHGVIGGQLTTGFSQGEKVAELALRILAGEPVRSITVVKDSPNRYIFDYSVMQKFAVSEGQLPQGSMIINKPISFYSQYRTYVWQTVAAFIVLMAVICMISFNLVRRRNAENALRRSEQRLRTIFQAAETVAFVITDAADPVPAIIEFSPGAEKIFACTREEMIGKPVSSLHLPEDVENFPEHHRFMRETKQGRSREITLLRSNGEQFPALFSTHPLIDESGKMWAALGVSIDISAQKKTEAALRESTERFRETSELLPETIFEIDFQGNILFLNKSGMEQFGFTTEELAAGLNAYDFFPGEEKAKLARNVGRLMQGEKIGLNEYLVRDKNAITYPVMTKSALIYRDGNPVGLRGFLIDITEKKQLEEDFHKAQRMESIGTLAGGIAHDFNNILMGIQGRTSLSLIHLPDTSPIKEHLVCIEDYVKNASTLTSQLLGFARSGRYNLQSTDINEMVENSATMFGRTKKELTLRQRLQEGLPPARVDGSQIEQVLLNLYVNAWQAMPSGGRLEIATRHSDIEETQAALLDLAPGRYIEISVTDSGTGIDEAIQPKIFEPFFTTKARGRGTGLGLASAYGIARNHHGTIRVTSKKGEGSTFTVYLPASEEQAKKKSVERIEELLTGKESILLIDDEPMIIEVASAILHHLGYSLHSVRSGKEAIAWYKDHCREIDLVVLDMIMPEMSGEEVFAQLKAINPSAKVLLSSGYSLAGQAERMLADGCAGFIQKPFDLQNFSRKIREMLYNG